MLGCGPGAPSFLSGWVGSVASDHGVILPVSLFVFLQSDPQSFKIGVLIFKQQNTSCPSLPKGGWTSSIHLVVLVCTKNKTIIVNTGHCYD